jgi:hypothetical protein
VSFYQCYRQLSITKIFKEIWAHFRRFAPETGLSGAPLSLRPRLRRGCFAPLQSLARLALFAAERVSITQFFLSSFLRFYDIWRKGQEKASGNKVKKSA